MSVSGSMLEFIFEHPILIVVTLLLSVCVFVLPKLFRGPEPGPNPFEQNLAREPRPLVTDKDERAKVLKQGKEMLKIIE